MPITKDTLVQTTKLSRITVSPEQESILTEHLSRILSYIEKLNSVNTEGIVPTFHPIRQMSSLREDEMQSFINQEILLKNAPEKSASFFVVPKIIE